MSNSAKACTDPIVGAILSGWRYDISSISPEMRTDYEQHLVECVQCRRRQSKARTIDVLLLAVTSLMIAGCLLTAVVLHRIELLKDIPAVHARLRSMPVTISLQAVDIAGLVVSSVLWILVAISTPVPTFLGDVVVKRLPPDLRQRIERRHA
jgi:hypothetical protein